jgi:putative Mg2+ transporter-C (MgtC) family protein
MWDEIAEGFRREFSDLSEFVSLTQLVLRLLIGCLLGGMIGYEREAHGKAAGLRTHLLVCVGTAFMVSIPQLAGMESSDLSRIIQGITAGVGFIGAGAIMKFENAGKIEGITTAAGIWFTAAIGIAVGLGREASALVGTFLVLAILYVIPALRVNARKAVDKK